MLNIKQKRLCRLIVFLTLLFLCAVIYAIIVMHIGKGIPCMFYVITGLKCPGCGISRMFLCLLKGDLHGAFRHNPVILFCMLPFAAVAADISYQYIAKGILTPHKWANILCCTLVVILIVFGVVRNIYS